MRILILFLFSSLVIFTSHQSSAQQIPALQFSNYGGLYRTTYNPSTLGGSQYKWQVNLGTLGGSINNRYFQFFGRNSFLYPILASHTSKELYGRSRTMSSLVKQDPIFLTSDIRWPSALISIDARQSIAIQFRTRGFFQGNGMPAAIGNAYFQRMDTGSLPEISDETWGDFNLVQQSFSEMSASYGIQLIDEPGQKLKVGGTLKRFFGARVSYLKGHVDQFSINATGPESSEIEIKNFNYESGYSQEVQAMKIGDLFSRNVYGNGAGVDLGITYELGSRWERPRGIYQKTPGYVLRLAASLTDIGMIKYKTKNSHIEKGAIERSIVDQAGLEKIGNEGVDGFASLFPGQGADSSFRQNVRLPQAFNIEADVQLWKGFFVNVATTQRLASRENNIFDIYQPNSITITPRTEEEGYDFAFPITFIDGNKKPTIGVVAHFGPVLLGFNNLSGLIKKSNPKGSMAYIGVSIWKFKDRKKSEILRLK